MGITIKLPGPSGAATVGQAVGAGFAGGIQQGQAQQRVDQLKQEELTRQQADADAIIQAIGDTVDTEFQNEAALVPDTITPRGRYGLSHQGISSKAGLLGQSMENPDDRKIRVEQERLKRLILNTKSVDAAKVLAESGDRRLLGLRRGRAMSTLNSSIEASVGAGLLTPDDARHYALALDSGQDPLAVLDAWNTDKSHRLEIQRIGRLKQAKLIRMAAMAEDAGARVGTATDANDRAWWTDQQERLQSYAEDVAAAYATDPEGFDMSRAYQAAMDIKNALNPHQEARVMERIASREETQKQEGRMSLQRARSVSDEVQAAQKLVASAVSANARAQAQQVYDGALAKQKAFWDEVDGSAGQGIPLVVAPGQEYAYQSDGNQMVRDKDQQPTIADPKAVLANQVRDAVMLSIGRIQNDGYATVDEMKTDAVELVKATYAAAGVSSMAELDAKFPNAAANLAALNEAIKAKTAPETIQQQTKFHLPLIKK